MHACKIPEEAIVSYEGESLDFELLSSEELPLKRWNLTNAHYHHRHHHHESSAKIYNWTESEAMVMNKENRASHCFEDPKVHFEENFVGSYIIAVYTTTYIAAASKQ